MNHMKCKLLFGKQESLESIQESWNQAKILKDSRIASIKIQSSGTIEKTLNKYYENYF